MFDNCSANREGSMKARTVADSSVRATKSLIYVPIIHTPAELGALREPVRDISIGKLGRAGWERNVELVEQLWTRIEHTIAGLRLRYDRTRIYQDGLPNCGRELQIVAELAKAGSRNHQLLLRLREKGATIMGTESPDLLLQEHKLMTEIYSSGGAQEVARRESQQEELRKSLLERRDQYIAERINSTLSNHETGVLFVGLLHSVAGFLNADIRVVYPLYRLPGHRNQAH